MLSLLLLVVFYGSYVFQPGSYLFSVSPDGIKGYYTYAWQTRYAESPLEFTGMNYPVGENMLFTDGHTSVSFLSWIFPFLKHVPVETINLLMLAGIILTAGVLCALLREWGARPAFAVTGAVIITFLSPTIMRMTGHFSLSYGFIIPLGMLWWTRLLKTGLYFKYSWRIGLLVLALFFTHAYPAMMLAAFIMLCAGCSILFNWSEIKKIKFWLGTCCATILPVIVFMLVVKLTDTHTNRPDTPTGFFENFAAWKGIFLPVSGFFNEWIKTKIDLSVVGWEKWAYLGTGTLLACALGGLLFFIPARALAAENRKPVSFLIFLIPAVLLLIFASGFPFRLYPHTADWVSFIKQFRVMARFAWPFYFVAGVYAVLFVQHICDKEKWYAGVKYALVTVVVVLSVLDISSYHHMMKGWLGKNKNIFHRSALDAELNEAIDRVKKENPGFLIVLPYFHVGSEEYTRSGTDKSRQMAFTFSYHTGKPLLNVEMSRTSVTETERLFDLFVPKYAMKKEHRNLLKGRVVLIDTREGTTYREKEMLKNCDLIYAGKQVNIYTANAQTLFASAPASKELASVGTDSLNVTHYYDYKNLPGEQLYAPMANYTILDTFVAGQLQKDSLYHISFHFKTEKGSRKGGMLVVQTIDKKGKIDWVEVVNLAQGGMSYRGKIIFEHSFIAKNPEKRYQIFINDGLGTNDNYIIDNFMFRNNSAHILSIENELLNNYPINKQ